LTRAAAELGEPIGLLDAGASAGLNLLVDRYRLVFGDAGAIGPADSPVQVECAVRGPGFSVPSRLPSIGIQVGLDRDPVDLSKEENARWLMACIWPGTGRHERAAAAIGMARRHPPRMRRGDMVEDLPAVLEEMGGCPTVVVTSWSYSYLPPDAQARFQQVLAEAGAARPVAWVCADTVGVVDRFEVPEGTASGDLVPGLLGMAVFDKGGVDSRSLAYIQPHGSWVEWFGTP